MLAGFPVLAQVGAFPPGEPPQEESVPSAETEPAPTAPPPSVGAPAEPPSPFGLSPDIFPGIFGGRPAPGGVPVEPASPFGISPDIFPGILGGRPDRQTQGQPAVPSEPGEPEFSIAPGGDRLEAAPEAVAPIGPEPELSGTPELVPPAFITPPFGFGDAVTAPSPFLPPNSASAAAATNPPSATTLGPLRPGALPVQAYDPRAPSILVRPTASVFAGYTDNPRSTPGTFPDGFARLRGGTAISVDTVRLQGQLNGSLDYQKYARTDRDRLNANLLAYGLATVVRDHIFLDARARVTQASRTGGLGFAGSDLIPTSQQTQVIATSLSPIVRQSFGGYVDGELRYNYGMTRFGRGDLLGVSDTAAPSTATASTNLRNATRNEGTLSLATGRLFTVFGSKLTLDALQVDSQSAARSTQLRAYDDLSYQFNQKFAGLARIGYEKINYPLQPAASATGPAWAIGGRYTPFPGSYLLGTYGRQNGLLGFSGRLRYEITPRTLALASLVRNRASPQEQILNNLNSSGVDASGNVVDQFSGLPTALVNPAFALTNAVFRFDRARVGLQTRLERDTFGLFVTYSKRAPLGRPIAAAADSFTAADNTSTGVNFSWARSLTPRLNSRAALGYVIQSRSGQTTLTASLNVTYTLGDRLRAILNYQFIDVNRADNGSSFRRNQVEIGLARSF